MDNDPKLIVPFDTIKTQKTIVLLPFMILATILCYWSIRYWLSNLIGYYAMFLITIIFIFLTMLFLIGLLYRIFLTKSNQPAAILDQKGIFIKQCGFIPWQEIDEFAPYYIPTAPLETIGIRVKDIAKLSRQSNLAGKCAIFWSTLFGYPPIILSNIALENEQVLSFASRFLNSHSMY